MNQMAGDVRDLPADLAEADPAPVEVEPSVIELMGALISGLHVPRSLGSVMVPKEYDLLRQRINDFGWSSGPEIADLLRRAIAKDIR